MDPEAMSAWALYIVLICTALCLSYWISERAVLALGPSLAAELVAGMASFALGSCLF